MKVPLHENSVRHSTFWRVFYIYHEILVKTFLNHTGPQVHDFEEKSNSKTSTQCSTSPHIKSGITLIMKQLWVSPKTKNSSIMKQLWNLMCLLSLKVIKIMIPYIRLSTGMKDIIFWVNYVYIVESVRSKRRDTST